MSRVLPFWAWGWFWEDRNGYDPYYTIGDLVGSELPHKRLVHRSRYVDGDLNPAARFRLAARRFVNSAQTPVSAPSRIPLGWWIRSICPMRPSLPARRIWLNLQ